MFNTLGMCLSFMLKTFNLTTGSMESGVCFRHDLGFTGNDCIWINTDIYLR